MAKYINADALIAYIDRTIPREVGEEFWKGAMTIRHVIQIQSTADVVEVVRCGQCKFFQSSGCFIGVQGAQVSSDSYCAWGQRKYG